MTIFFDEFCDEFIDEFCDEFLANFVTNFDSSEDFFLTYDLLTIASLRIGVPSILFEES